MKKLTNILLVGATALLVYSPAEATEPARYYSGSAVLISADNFIISNGRSLLQRSYDPDNKNLIENVTIFDAVRVGISTATQKKHIDAVVYSDKQHVTYSTMLSDDGGKVSVVDMEVIEGLFSEFKIYDKNGNFINAFLSWGSEITKSEYKKK